MFLARGGFRSRSLGRARAPPLSCGGCNDDIAAWTTLFYRKAGGVSGKRRSKYKGQYKASAGECSNIQHTLYPLEDVAMEYNALLVF